MKLKRQITVSKKCDFKKEIYNLAPKALLPLVYLDLLANNPKFLQRHHPKGLSLSWYSSDNIYGRENVSLKIVHISKKTPVTSIKLAITGKGEMKHVIVNFSPTYSTFRVTMLKCNRLFISKFTLKSKVLRTLWIKLLHERFNSILPYILPDLAVLVLQYLTPVPKNKKCYWLTVESNLTRPEYGLYRF